MKRNGATLADLQPDPRNANKGTERGRHLLEKSLSDYGAGRSILIDKNGKIIAGNKTAEVAAALGLEDVVIVQSDGTKLVAVQRTDIDLDTEAGRMLAYADNRVGQVDLDFDIEEIIADVNAGLPLDDFWFESEIEEMIAGLVGDAPPAPGDAEPQTNRAEELQGEWQTATGQLWRLPSRDGKGEHRLIVGDCTDRVVVERVMGNEKANGCFTSPPYAEQRAHVYDSHSEEKYGVWWDCVQQSARNSLRDNSNFFVNIKPHSKDYERSLYVMDLVLAMAREWGWRYIDEFCWLRSGIPGDPLKMGKFKNQFEPVYHFALGKYPFYPDNVTHETDNAILDTNYDPGFGRNFQGKGMNRFGARKQGKGLAYPGNVIKANGNESHGHEAAFPVDLPGFFIRAYSEPGDIWLDPFAGSGTTLIACENLNRYGRAVEISPAYCAVILQRYQDAFGITPELIA